MIPTRLSAAASVFPSKSVSSRSDVSDDVRCVGSSISWSSFKSLYFLSDTTFIVLYKLAAECGKRGQLLGLNLKFYLSLVNK